jgi:hypothetical protein
MPELSHRPLAHSLEDIRPLHQLCREGRLYDVERWIADGKPLQLTPESLPKGAEDGAANRPRNRPALTRYPSATEWLPARA